MRHLLLIPLLLLFASCGTLGNLSESIREGRDLIAQARDTVEKVKPEIDKIAELVKDLSEMGDGLKGDLGDAVGEFKDLHEKAKEEADKDGDGELSLTEWIAYILGAGGGGAVLLRKYLQRLKERVAREAVAEAERASQEAQA